VTTLNGAPTTGATMLETRHDSQYRVNEMQVDVLSLDDLVSAGEIPGIPEVLKIDVEGYELEVLKGAGRLFGKTELVILEVSLYRFWGQPVFHEVVAWMADRGYVLYDFAGFNRRPKDGTLGQADACFIRQDSRLRRDGTGWNE
jgi:hypothetical protein